MTDAELRALVRDAVARHLGGASGTPPSAPDPADPAGLSLARSSPPALHASQALYVTLVNAGDACLIEPSVPCNHCGYCRTHGH